MTKAQPKPDQFVFRIERTFNAPRERVWKAWTDPEQVKQWFGPKGAKMLYNKIDLRPGGRSAYGMEFEEHKMFGQWAYLDIKEPEKIVALVSFLDENGNKIKHPMSPDWPLDVHSVITFIGIGEKTKITVEWTAYNATAAEAKTFEEGMEGMNQGWSGTFEQLEEFLAK